MRIINTIVKSQINKRNTKYITKATKKLSDKLSAMEKRLDNVLKESEYGKLKRT